MELSNMFQMILIIIYLHFSESAFGRKKKFQMLRYVECEDYPNLPMRVSDFKNHVYGKNNRTMEMTLNVDREVGADMYVATNLWKCDLSGAPDTCEYFIKDLKINKLCERMPQKKQAWTEFVDSFKPPISCPIKKGKYTSEAPISDETFRYYPLPTGLWKSKSLIYEKDDVLICCLDLHVKIFEVRE